jgi:hypothetical protein
MAYFDTDSIIHLTDDKGNIVKEIDILNDHIESDSVKLAYVIALTQKAIDMFEIALRCYRTISTSDQNKTAVFQNRLKEARQKIIDALK